MRNKDKRSIAVRVLNGVCAIALLACVMYIVFVGFHAAAIGAALLALGAVTVPAAMGGEGIVDIISEIFDALIEGFIGIFEAIAEFISGLFG